MSAGMRARLPRIGMPGLTAIGVKELRGRMRGRRAFVSVTFYVLIVAGFTWMVGRILEDSARQQFGFNPTFQSASIGRGIFAALMFLQTLMIAILAPASTAGTISGERERQTLDLLAVTPISSVAIVVGKLLSSLTWVFVLITASIPVAALVFVYGGVAPDDLLRGYLVLFVTAIAFGALGTFFSALLRRSGAATGLTFVGVLVATVGLTFIWVFFRATEANNLDAAGLAARRPAEALLYLNPFVAQADVACGAEGGTGGWCLIIAQVTGDASVLNQGGGPVAPIPVPAGKGGVIVDGGGGVANDVNGGFGNARDTYWPRSVLTLLLLAVVCTTAAVQLVTPTRRWRPGRPGSRRGNRPPKAP